MDSWSGEVVDEVMEESVERQSCILSNVGHQFSGHPTFPATRVDAFLVPPPLINPPSFDQLPFPLL